MCKVICAAHRQTDMATLIREGPLLVSHVRQFATDSVFFLLNLKLRSKLHTFLHLYVYYVQKKLSIIILGLFLYILFMLLLILYLK